MKKILVCMLFFLLACSGFKKKAENSELLRIEEAYLSIKKINKLNLKIERLEEENLVLQSLLSRISLKNSNKNNQKNTSFIIPTQSESGLYDYIIKNYKNDEYRKFEVAMNFFIKAYPLSVKIDDVLFLKAEYLFNNGKETQSLKLCKKIDEKYPYADKRLEALKLTAKIYKRLFLLKASRLVLNKINKDYPEIKKSALVKSKSFKLKRSL